MWLSRSPARRRRRARSSTRGDRRPGVGGAREPGRARRESDRGEGDGRRLCRRGRAHRAAHRSLILAYLKLDRLVKSYDGRVNAVDGISLDIAKGEFLTLLGPSGSGKTTTLMMIAGFEEPTSGVIELGGEDLTRRKPYERNIGVVFQNYALFPHMTVQENVAFPLRMRAFPRAQQAERVREILPCRAAPVRRQASAPALRRPAAARRARAWPRLQPGR